MEVDSQEIKLALQQNGVKNVKVAITDIDGVLRGKYMHVDKFLKSIESGYGFCDVIFGWDSSDHSMSLKFLMSRIYLQVGIQVFRIKLSKFF
ncbi:MAG: hypothetical protein CM1200mP12_20080 [Gammaproteobacteria bacterium]|nr:MAG: hypothetical protein CM1200mP12_20080 [Gammaproteobacteria bacterium]